MVRCWLRCQCKARTKIPVHLVNRLDHYKVPSHSPAQATSIQIETPVEIFFQPVNDMIPGLTDDDQSIFQIPASQAFLSKPPHYTSAIPTPPSQTICTPHQAALSMHTCGQRSHANARDPIRSSLHRHTCTNAPTIPTSTSSTPSSCTQNLSLHSRRSSPSRI